MATYHPVRESKNEKVVPWPAAPGLSRDLPSCHFSVLPTQHPSNDLESPQEELFVILNDCRQR